MNILKIKLGAFFAIALLNCNSFYSSCKLECRKIYLISNNYYQAEFALDTCSYQVTFIQSDLTFNTIYYEYNIVDSCIDTIKIFINLPITNYKENIDFDSLSLIIKKENPNYFIDTTYNYFFNTENIDNFDGKSFSCEMLYSTSTIYFQKYLRILMVNILYKKETKFDIYDFYRKLYETIKIIEITH